MKSQMDRKVQVSLLVREWWARWVSYEEPTLEQDKALNKLESLIEGLLEKRVDFLVK